MTQLHTLEVLEKTTMLQLVRHKFSYLIQHQDFPYLVLNRWMETANGGPDRFFQSCSKTKTDQYSKVVQLCNNI